MVEEYAESGNCCVDIDEGIERIRDVVRACGYKSSEKCVASERVFLQELGDGREL